MENEIKGAAYALGIIQGIKFILTEMAERAEILDSPDKGIRKTELSAFITHVNGLEVVKENGMFAIEPEERYPTFCWIQERRDYISKQIKNS